jgi:hypothetical protein
MISNSQILPLEGFSQMMTYKFDDVWMTEFGQELQLSDIHYTGQPHGLQKVMMIP